MSRLKYILPVVLILVGLGLSAALVKARKPADQRPPEAVTPLVRALEVVAQDHQFVVTSQGTVEARTEIDLVAETGGRVIEVSPDLVAGGFFAKGAVLARIEPVDYEAALAQVEASLRQAEVGLELEKAQAEISRSEWADLGLQETNPLAVRELQVKEAEARVAAARASRNQARKNLERTWIRAPFDGRIRRKHVDIGQYLAPGTPVARVYAVDYVEVRLPISGEDVAFADFPMLGGGEELPVELNVEFAGRTHSWNGSIVRTEGVIDPQSRMMYVVARVENPYAEGSAAPLAVGLYARAAIAGRVAHGVYLLPRAALRNQTQVVLIDADNRLRYRAVDVLRLEGETVVIGAGLADGERVLVSPMTTIVEGMPVRLSDETIRRELGEGAEL